MASPRLSEPKKAKTPVYCCSCNRPVFDLQVKEGMTEVIVQIICHSSKITYLFNRDENLVNKWLLLYLAGAFAVELRRHEIENVAIETIVMVESDFEKELKKLDKSLEHEK